MTEAEDFIYQFERSQREVMLYLHDLLTMDLNMTSKIKFKIPFYYRKSWICYLNPTKYDKIEFAFTRGNELSNYQGILENRGRKQVYSVIFKKISEIPMVQMKEIIQEAILLDEMKPYKSKRKNH